MPLPLQSFLEQTHARLAGLTGGEVASYIPELAKADPDWFGLCLVTVDGQCYAVGDTEQPFTIQSISKPLTLGLALDELGPAAVAARVGVEPSGDAFNSISLEPASGRPLNPMINAGAIATAGLIAALDPQHARGRLLGCYGRAAGRALSVDDPVFRSEAATGHRNRAIAHLLRNFDMLTDPDAALDLYFRQCSVAVTCRDLAMIGATLANKGVHPRTGLHAFRPATAQRVLSVMSSCGMYDYSGSWVYEVGMPAKSGVGGGIVAVSPGQFGLAVFSPRLDARGNSVRGIAVCQAVSAEFGLHVFDNARATRAVLRARYDATTRRSTRERSREESALLDRHGRRIQLCELQGDLLFGGTEYLSRELSGVPADVRFVILDFKRVLSLSRAAASFLQTAAADFAARGVALILTRVDHLEEAGALLEATPTLASAATTDDALRRCEDALLERGAPVPVDDLQGFDFFAELDADELAMLTPTLAEVTLEPATALFRQGDAADALFLIREGGVSVIACGDNGDDVRIGAVMPGMVLGEMALIDGGRRTAAAVADTPTRCWRLGRDELDRLPPAVLQKLLAALARSLAARLERANRQIAALA